VYGARKLWRALRREGTDVGRDQGARLMRVPGLAGAIREEMAIWGRRAADLAGWVHYSGRGAQYLAIQYTERLKDERAVTSVGSKGDSYLIAPAESVDGLYKTELNRAQGNWRTTDQVELATAAWVAWWNAERLLGACGDIPPAELEAAHHQRRATIQAARIQSAESPLNPGRFRVVNAAPCRS
jgi:transposase InsO family protein